MKKISQNELVIQDKTFLYLKKKFIINNMKIKLFSESIIELIFIKSER